MNFNKPLILASGSPRRRELLSQAGFTYTVCVSDCEEHITKTLPAEIVCDLSLQKASDVAGRMQTPCCVIGADTVVACDDRILGKPRTSEEAEKMLSMLQGRTHQVYTGVTFAETEAAGRISRTHTFFECTDVTVCPMTAAEIKAYVQTGEPMDKAGAYGIQGAFCTYVQGIQGDYYNVVGLPVSRLYHELLSFFNC